MPPLRQIVLAVALVATVVASIVDLPAPETVEPQKAVPVAVSAPVPAAVRAAAPVNANPYSPRIPFGTQVADLFAARSWQAPPTLAPVPKAPAPVAPPLPFVYMGKLLQQDEVVAFLGLGTRTYLLRRGDVVADYKVMEVTPSEMSFLYLPLNEKQRLSFGSAH